MAILGAEQKDCCLWGEECVIAGLQWPHQVELHTHIGKKRKPVNRFSHSYQYDG